MPRPDIEAILKRCEAATKGQWRVEEIPDYDEPEVIASRGIMSEHTKQGLNEGVDFELFKPEDAEMIAHSRTDLPAVCEYANELEELVNDAREIFRLMPAGHDAEIECWLEQANIVPTPQIRTRRDD